MALYGNQDTRKYFQVVLKVILCFIGIRIVSSEIFEREFGWCQTGIGKNNFYDGFVKYNVKTMSCVKCGGKFTMETRENMKTLKCCSDGVMKEKCTNEELQCSNGGYFKESEKCDGIKNCVDGTDEVNCTAECQQFSCRNPSKNGKQKVEQCISVNKLCDGRKDCISGLDESNCVYYDGKCDGFLCTRVEQCINVTEVCDGSKNCFDGSDETTCEKFVKSEAFECNSKDEKEGFAYSDICDGYKDCARGEDEDNCFKWEEWTSWSNCQCLTASDGIEVVNRKRSCATLHIHVKSENKCTGPNTENRNMTCNCAPSTTEVPESGKLSITVILVIILASTLTLVGGLLIMNMVMRQKRAWQSYTQAAVTFANHPTDSLLSPLPMDVNNENHTTPPQLQSRRLPSTPGITSNTSHTYSSVRFGSDWSVRNNHMESYQASILTPYDDDSLYRKTVANPLYHSYNGKHTEQLSLSVPNLTASYVSCESVGIGTPSGVSDVEYTEVFHEVDEEDLPSTLMEQIEIAQMGNLIEVSDTTIE
uniref:uncharacterized protein LOC120333415 isoform X1 n=1 Tax=Styela clava TaxID=7725 RepID=UPI00193A55E9|nr:uncharacterized protein LOC120333415 isoform X1 [Styela clava]